MSIILEIIKKLIIKFGIVCLSLLPKTALITKISKRFYLADLKRRDWARWNVEKAKSIGVKVGENCRFYSVNVFSEPYLLEVGNEVIVSGEVIFVTHDGGIFLLKNDIADLRGYFGRIKIGNNCFIGMGAIILPNVQIGNNCIVGAGSVVAQSFPDDTVIMGNPAKAVFKTSMYILMRKNSQNTVTCPEWPFPTRISDDIKKDLLLNKCNIPEPARPRIRKKLGN